MGAGEADNGELRRLVEMASKILRIGREVIRQDNLVRGRLRYTSALTQGMCAMLIPSGVSAP